MIHDAKVEVTCDGEKCRESVTVSPHFMHRDYSGKNGFYDCSDDAIEELLGLEGWTTDGEEHFCPSCSPDPEEDDPEAA
jgi:hypothetical protein